MPLLLLRPAAFARDLCHIFLERHRGHAWQPVGCSCFEFGGNWILIRSGLLRILYVPCHFTRRTPKVVLGNFNGPLAFWFVCVRTEACCCVECSLFSFFPVIGNLFGNSRFPGLHVGGCWGGKKQEGTHPTGSKKLGNVAFKRDNNNEQPPLFVDNTVRAHIMYTTS